MDSQLPLQCLSTAVLDSEEEATQWAGRTAFQVKSKDIIGEPIESLKIQVNPIVSGAFEAPVTDFGFVKLKREADQAELNATMEGLMKLMGDGKKGSYAPTFGPVNGGKATDIAIIVGWDSREVSVSTLALKDSDSFCAGTFECSQGRTKTAEAR
jgi:hypothetical protein